MSKSEPIVQEPEIAIFQATDTGEEPNGPSDDNVRFNGWKVIRSGSHALGKWSAGTESHSDKPVWEPGLEAMQQMVNAGEWNDPSYRDPVGKAHIFTVGEHTTPWHVEQIVKVHENGYRVGVLVPSDPAVRARIRKIYDAGIVTIDLDSLNSVTGHAELIDSLALESMVLEFAYS